MVAVTKVLLAGAAAVTEDGSMITWVAPPPAEVTPLAPPAAPATVTVLGGLALRRAWAAPMEAGRMLPLGATMGGGGGLCRPAGGCCRMAAMVGT